MKRSENTAEGTMTVIPLPFSPLSLSPKKLVSELKELRGEVEEWGGGAGWGRFPVAEPCTGGEFKRWGSSLGITPCPAAFPLPGALGSRPADSQSLP